jgi:hypothetical protein
VSVVDVEAVSVVDFETVSVVGEETSRFNTWNICWQKHDVIAC